MGDFYYLSELEEFSAILAGNEIGRVWKMKHWFRNEISSLSRVRAASDCIRACSRIGDDPADFSSGLHVSSNVDISKFERRICTSLASAVQKPQPGLAEWFHCVCVSYDNSCEKLHALRGRGIGYCCMHPFRWWRLILARRKANRRFSLAELACIACNRFVKDGLFNAKSFSEYFFN